MSFQKSLGMGKLGEALFYQAHKGTLSETDGRKGDFLHVDGYKVELKTDFWQMSKTPNFFFELYSDLESKSPGGPFQALEHGAERYVYFYVADLTYYEFKTADIAAWLIENSDSLMRRTVINSSWSTEGYLVPRDRVLHLAQPQFLQVSIRYE
jgi:hypothetical protein